MLVFVCMCVYVTFVPLSPLRVLGKRAGRLYSQFPLCTCLPIFKSRLVELIPTSFRNRGKRSHETHLPSGYRVLLPVAITTSTKELPCSEFANTKVPSLCKRQGKRGKSNTTYLHSRRWNTRATRLPRDKDSLSPATLVVLGNICDKHPDLTESSTLSRGEVRHKFGFAVLLAADISEKQWRCGPPRITICPQLRYLLCLWLFDFRWEAVQLEVELPVWDVIPEQGEKHGWRSRHFP